MKGEEYNYLKNGKINGGKSHEQARKELQQLQESQINFKILKKELKKKDTIIKNLNKQIEKLQKSHFKDILPRTEEKIVQINNSKNNEATVKELNRIMVLIDAEERIGLNDLTKTCSIKPKTIKGALNFLVRNNIIREVNEGKTLMLEKI